MPQKLLHNLEFRPDAPQKRRVGMPERVPTNPFLDSNPLCNRAYNIAQNRLSPVWMASAIVLIGENPVIGFAIPAAVSSFDERLCKNWMNGHGLLGRFCLASTDDAIDNRPCHIHRALSEIDVAPLEGKYLTLAQAG